MSYRVLSINGCCGRSTEKTPPKRKDTNGIERYVYSELKDPHKDIRLLELLPGSFDNDIKIRIFHASLVAAARDSRQQMTPREVNRTLPPHWMTYETYEGRYLYKNEEEEYTTWIHPDPNFQNNTQGQGSNNGNTLDFEALSYVWGSTENPEDVLIVSHSQPEDCASLAIGQNLASALRHLRYDNTSRTLWIDIISINQSDLKEREAQLLRMADIYSLATLVTVWLGPHTKDSGEAIRALKYFGEQVVMAVGRRRFRAPGANELSWHEPDFELPFRPETWDAICDLLSRQWFERVWVLQEIKLANPRASIQCGHDHISWTLFRRAVMCLKPKRHLPLGTFRANVDYVEAMMAIDHLRYPMSIMLFQFTERKATDPRDKVYGLLGLLPSAYRHRVTPQYGSSVANVYKNVIQAHIQHTKRLELLQRCGHETDIKIPSWAFDFSNEKPTQGGLDWQFASLKTACQAHFQASDELKVVGVKVATLRNVKSGNRMPGLDPGELDSSYENVLRAIRKAEPNNLNEATYRTGETFREAYSQTLIGNRLRPRHAEWERCDNIDTWKLQKSKNALFGDSAADGGVDVADMSLSESDALRVLIGRSLLESDEGFIGLGPGDVQRGDIVAVLLGCQSPMVLRAELAGRFKIIGECYMHGLSDGVGLLGPLPNPWTIRVIAGSLNLGADYYYLNTETGKQTREDPRLEPLPDVWERVNMERTSDLPLIYEHFKNKVTGEIIDLDPRLGPEALKARGVDLREFILM